MRKSEISLIEMESESKDHFDDLDVALILMKKLSELFHRHKVTNRAKLMQTLATHIQERFQDQIDKVHQLYLEDLINVLT